MHAVEATESLATNITLSVQAGGSLYIMESPFWYRPAEHALGEIGVPAIPALLRNLVESQDANTRDASLRVLVGIDGDKDVVQLRLQKALKAGKGSERQARLQAALKALADPAVQR